MTKARRSLPRVPPGAHASDLAARRRARVHVLRRQRGRRRHRLGVGRGAPTRCKEPFFAKAPPLSGTWMPIRPPSRTAAAGWRSSATTATASRASRSSSPSSCTPTPLGRRRPTPIRSSCSLRAAPPHHPIPVSSPQTTFDFSFLFLSALTITNTSPHQQPLLTTSPPHLHSSRRAEPCVSLAGNVPEPCGSWVRGREEQVAHPRVHWAFAH